MRRMMMCLVASLITFSGASAFAQSDITMGEDDGTGFQLGVVGLANLSTLAYSADDGDVSSTASDYTEYTLGFGGGIRAIAQFTPYIGVQPEILFKQYGAKYSADLGPFSAEATSTTNYLEVPILARIAVPTGGAITPKLLVGPTFGYFISGETKVGDNTEEMDADDVEKLNIGIAAGLGADIAAGPGSLSFDLRYDRSFTQSNKPSDIDQGLKAFNTGFSAMLGYNFKL